MTSNDLKLLATTNFNLGELYKLKTLSQNIGHLGEHTFNNWNFMGSVPNVSSCMELSRIKPLKQIIKESNTRQTVEGINEDFVENEDSMDRYFTIYSITVQMFCSLFCLSQMMQIVLNLTARS